MFDPTARLGPRLDQEWDALERLKYSRGAQWTDEMASIVEHHVRHNWDVAPRHDETRHRWGIRVDTTCDYYQEDMAQWLDKPLQAAQSPGQGQREENPSNSEEPPKDQRGCQPQERPEDRRGGGSGYQEGGNA